MARRIGVEVTTETRGGPGAVGGPAGPFHIAGVTERGPVGEIVAVRSLPEYERLMGGRTPYSGAMYDSARTFFNEGGTELLVSRVVGASSSAAAVELAGPGDGETAGEPVIRVEAAEVGGFANDYQVEVERVEAAYTVTVTDADAAVLFVARSVATIDDLVAAAGSSTTVNLASLADQEGLSLEPGTFDLTGGADDRENVAGEDVLAALNSGGDAGEGGAVAAPGYPADVIGEGLVEHASTHRKIALLASYHDASTAELEQVANQLIENTTGEYAALFHAPLRISDASGARTVSPEAFAAAKRSATFSTGQFWEIPAGTDRGRARWVTGTSPALSRADVERLDTAQVNGIETSGSRVFLNNWTSLARDREELGHLRDMDVLNNLSVMIEASLEQFVWETIDSRGLLLSDVEAAVTAILSGMAADGGVWAKTDRDTGEEVDPGYQVSVNPDPGLAAQNKVEVSAAVRLPGAAKLISVGLIKVSIGGDF